MNEPARLVIKFVSRIILPDASYGKDYLRRFPNRIPRLGGCEFVFDPSARHYDWLVVYDDLPRNMTEETLACDPAHTLFITSEPSSITAYGKAFTRQFAHVLTSQEPWALEHPGVLREQPGLLWCYGGQSERGTYDSLRDTGPMLKTKEVSTVCSAKAMRHTLHHKRLAITNALAAQIPELDVFGFGLKHIKDKADAITPYKYHIAIENHESPHHWTEKLSDAYLGYSLPLYFGCTNPEDYFPADSFIKLDIHDYKKAASLVKQLLHSDEYEKRLPSIIEARKRVLSRYATFPNIVRTIERLHHSAPKTPPSASATILSRRTLRASNPFYALGDVKDKIVRRLYWLAVNNLPHKKSAQATLALRQTS